jgi:hypothetical protein
VTFEEIQDFEVSLVYIGICVISCYDCEISQQQMKLIVKYQPLEFITGCDACFHRRDEQPIEKNLNVSKRFALKVLISFVVEKFHNHNMK